MASAGLDMGEVTEEEWSAAKRMKYAHDLHVMADRENRVHRTTAPFVAINLEDGSSDGVLYDSRSDAVRHQKSDNRFYVKLGLREMPLREALVCLMYARRAYRTGHVFAEEEVVMPQRLELAQPFIPRTLRGMNYRG